MRVMTRRVTTDLEMLLELVSPDGLEVVDIGCGNGDLVRALAGRGSHVVGIEVSDGQLSAAIAADPDRSGRYVVGRAERLPLADASVDIAIFMRSLHHVAVGEQPAALREAARVTRPGGSVYIAEPLPEGDYFELISLVEDEVEERRAAQRAIADAGAHGLATAVSVEYEVLVTLSGVEELRARVVAVDPDRAAVFDERHADLAATFARVGRSAERAGERCFAIQMKADLLRVAPRE
jgi:SAM-dependent methyltransferase